MDTSLPGCGLSMLPTSLSFVLFQISALAIVVKLLPSARLEGAVADMVAPSAPSGAATAFISSVAAGANALMGSVISME